ncbi:photosystem II stability/assembly factor-like uncharacterized protein [Halospina denitrificans]|uniref:Photosystem II stability/assembly factor-like uncharacterized protein n=1 Tax=Halospina denitrificans TaxID=332522 RepID=A0A4R7JKP7_9GAMM|nr:YCF48-related protein [Halospina denitrificans]TDT38581.1 photosystem II stability/assembly factor-like uncharacterized protein [Halospina denitrificans]
MFKKPGKRSLAVASLCIGLWGGLSSPAYAVGDVLEIPALETDLAASSLLLDITRAGDRLVAVGERGHIVYSDNGGDSWTQASVPVSTTLTGVDFPTADEGWAVGHSGVILHSSDGGESWEHQFDGRDGVPQVVDYYDQKIAEMEERIEETDDQDKVADLEWEMDDFVFNKEDLQADLKEFGPWHPLLDVWFENEDHGFAVGAYGNIYRTKDGGETWKTRMGSIENPNRFHLNGITRVEGGDLYIAGESGFVFRSTDNGQSWEQLEPGYPGSFFGVVGTGDEDEVLAYGLRGNIYRSVGGDEWESVDSGTDNTLNSAHANDNGEIAMVGNSGSVVYSDDGGENFSSIIRPSRLSYVGVMLVPGEGLVLVGEKGAIRTDRQGRDLLL